MGRRKNGLLDDLSYLPWWVSVVLAFIVYVCVGYIPSIVIGNLENPFHEILRPIFLILGWIFAAIFLIPAVISFFNQVRKKRLLDRQSDLEDIRSLSWREFEELIAEAFRRQGYTVIENAGGGADGGIDIRLRKEGRRYLVQCKNWSKQKVGVAIVREMYGVLTAESASEVFIVCSGRFTQEAVQFASGKPVRLIGGKEVMEMVGDVRGGPANRGASGRTVGTGSVPPCCPECGSRLIVRTARRGKYAGQQFLGCEGFPKCRFKQSEI